jgi:hypothetical protein
VARTATDAALGAAIGGALGAIDAAFYLLTRSGAEASLWAAGLLLQRGLSCGCLIGSIPRPGRPSGLAIAAALGGGTGLVSRPLSEGMVEATFFGAVAGIVVACGLAVRRIPEPRSRP